jgi:hypothetical protein
VRTTRGLCAGLVAGLSAYALLASGVLGGTGALCLVLLLLVAVPTSPDLGRRLSLNGALAIGWSPVLWWVRWPSGVDRSAVAVGVVVGVLAWWVGRSDRHAWSRLVPRGRAVDGLVLVGGFLALACMRRWAFPGSAHQALVALLPGADNYAHFQMFSTIRSHGAVTSALGAAGDGSGWGFDNYPQGFHALAATASQLLRPDLRPGVGSLVAYTQVVAVLVVLGTVVLTATVVSLPGLRDRPLVALPVVACTWAGFLWQPGQSLLADGFANFWLAAVAVGCALLVTVAPHRRLGAPEAFAVAGLVLVVAHAWAPLVVVAAPAGLALLHPFDARLRSPGLRRRLAGTVLALVLGGLGVLKALVALFADIDVGHLVTAFGGIHGTNPLPTFLLVVVAAYVCCTAPSVVRRHGGGAELLEVARRVRLLGLAPLAGLALGALLLAAQLRTVGTSSYYFVKFAMGYELVLAAFVPAVVGVLLAGLLPPVPRRARGARTAVPAALLVTVLASQAFGPFLGRTAPLLDAHRSGTASVGAPLSVDGIADGIIAAVGDGRPGSSLRRDYLSIGAGSAAEAFYPDGWYHGALATLTGRTFRRLDVLRTRVPGVDAAVPVARRLLSEDRGLEIIVDPRYADDLRRRLGDTDLSSRITSWDRTPADHAG